MMNGERDNWSQQRLFGYLQRARRTILAAGLLRGMLRWAGISLLVWGGLAAFDILLAFPMEFRLPLMVAAVAVTAVMLVKAVVRPCLAYHDLDRTALALERRFGVPRNLLINSFQLSRQSLSREEAILARQPIEQGLGRCTVIAPRELWQRPALLKTAVLALAIGVVWLVAGIRFPSHVSITLTRLWRPLADVPPAGKVILTVVPDDQVSVLEGDSHQVWLRVTPRSRRRPAAGLDDGFRPRIVAADTRMIGVAQGAREAGQAMLPADRGPAGEPAAAGIAWYTHTFNDMQRSQAFRIYHDSGGTYSRSYHVQVQRAPELVASEFRITPPAYTGLTRSDLPGPPRPVMGLPESAVSIELRLDRPVDNLFWESGDTLLAFRGNGGTDWRAETMIRDAGAYTVFTRLDAQDRRLTIAAGSLLVDRDQPPRVTFATDRLNREAWPGETMDFEILAMDDHGIAEVTLSVTPAHAFGEASQPIAAWTFDGPPGESRPDPLRVAHTLNPNDFTPGDDYLFQATARDFHPQGQTGVSRPLLIRIRGMADVPEAFPVSSALDALQQAIVWQRRALSDSRTVIDYMDAVLGRDPDRPEFSFHHHRQAMETRQEQVDVLLGLVIERAVDPGRSLIRAVDEVRRHDAQPLVADIRRLAGDPEPWFDARIEPIERDTPDGRFRSQRSRFIGLAWPGGGDGVGLAMLELTDAAGHLIPPPYVDEYHFSPHFHQWDGPVDFVDCDAAELKRLTDTALATPLRGGSGPLMNWRGQVEGAPARRVALYGARRIRGRRGQQVVMWTGGSDSLRVWLNGERRVNRLARRAPSVDQERTVLELRRGENRLLVEVSVDNRDPVMALRFSKLDGAPLALTADGRLEEAILPKVIYAGGAPGHAGQALDRNRRTAWQVAGNRPRLFICDLGQVRNLRDVRLVLPRGRDPAGVGSYQLFLAETLRIHTALPPIIDDLAARQSAILDRLTAIRAAWLEDDATEQPDAPEPESPEESDVPTPAVAGHPRELVAELLDTSADSIQQSQQRRSVLDQAGEDFSEEILARLLDIKDRERRLANYLRDIVQDMSVLGDLDVSDATQVANFQELVELAERLAELATEKADQPITQITDSLDTAEIELHEELLKQSEAAFGDTSRIQDMQEIGEDLKTPLPMAELPQTLSDLVGEMEEGLLEYEDEAQTVGSMLKSLDAEGPIGPGRMASTSAEGKTGDEPPDAARELEGRSGFGRTGRASGEGVTDVAEDLPQDSAAAPPRDTGTALDAGMVEDRSTEATAESTGLGKETDDTETFGMGGSPLPPGLLDRLRQTARQQDDLRETVGQMILELRRHNIPSAKLSRAARAMDSIAESARDGNPPEFFHAYRDALDHLYEAEDDIGYHVGVRYVLERRDPGGGDACSTTPTDAPDAYRDLIAEYFKALAREADTDIEP